MTTSKLYEEMTETCNAWEADRERRRAAKQEIIDNLGRDSAELKAWYEEDKAKAFPYSKGQMKAYRAIRDSVDEVEVSDFCFDEERHDFIDTFRRMGVTEFTVTDQSAGLMDDIYGYIAEGYTKQGVHSIIRNDNRWGGEEPEEKKGMPMWARAVSPARRSHSSCQMRHG